MKKYIGAFGHAAQLPHLDPEALPDLLQPREVLRGEALPLLPFLLLFLPPLPLLLLRPLLLRLLLPHKVEHGGGGGLSPAAYMFARIQLIVLTVVYGNRI